MSIRRFVEWFDWRLVVSFLASIVVCFAVFAGVKGELDRGRLIDTLEERIQKVNELRDRIDILNDEIVNGNATISVLVYEIAILRNEITKLGGTPPPDPGASTGSGGTTPTTTPPTVPDSPGKSPAGICSLVPAVCA